MVVFEAFLRDGVGKGVARKLRREGYIPAVIYGGDLGNKPIAVSKKSISKYLKGAISEAHIWKLRIEGYGEKDVIIKDVQKDPITGDVLHIDFYELVATKTVTVAVPVKIVGEPVGVKKGGTLEVIKTEIEIECLPKDIMEEIVIDVSGLDIGDTIFVSDLQVPQGIKIVDHPEEPVVTVVAAEEEEAEESETQE